MRIMAIDYGDARTGVAISDPPACWPASPTAIQPEERAGVDGGWPPLIAAHGWTSWLWVSPEHGRHRRAPGRAVPGLCCPAGGARGWRCAFGTNAAPPSRPPDPLPRLGKKMKNHKRTWTRWLLLLFWKDI